MNIFETLAKEFGITEEQVEKTVALIDEGNTIPFISRYRKEVTGSLDDTTLRDLIHCQQLHLQNTNQHHLQSLHHTLHIPKLLRYK